MSSGSAFLFHRLYVAATYNNVDHHLWILLPTHLRQQVDGEFTPASASRFNSR